MNKMKKYIVNIYTTEKAATIEMKLGDVYIAHSVMFRFFPHFPFFTLIKLAAIIRWQQFVKWYKEIDFEETIARL